MGIPSAAVELFDAVGKPLSYAIPFQSWAEITEGALVRVPLNNRFTTGVVAKVGDPAYDGNLRPIKNVIYHLPPDLMPFARWLCRYYGTSLSSALGVIVPKEMRRCRQNPPIFTEKTVIKNYPRADALVDILISNLISEKFHTVLLREWNFYWRAEIYAMLVAKTLNLGESVLILAPEISKAERLAKFLGQHLGIPCLQWHSRLTLKDRAAIWNTLIENNGPLVVVGTPGSIFLPIVAPRLIIVDDEEDDSYKCKRIPRFHRRDCAVYRAWLNQALCVLGSGAPSMESIQACNRKKFRYLPSNSPAPGAVGNIRVIDIKKSGQNKSLITPCLEVELGKCIQNGKQGILILNRLGYERCIFCHRCNFELPCPRCGASMALQRAERQCFCPVCNHTRRPTRQCPKCHTRSLRARGAGIERIEEILRQIFPKARILCCDHSTLSSPRKIRAFQDTVQNANIDIVVGTNAVIGLIRTPRVGLVSMLNVDLESRRADFRAGERAFQTVSRVCHICAAPLGQSEPIPLILQTYDPNGTILNAAVDGDPSSFYAAELADREILGYPPHLHLIQQLFFGKSDEEVKCFANRWAELLKDKVRASRSFQLKGPRKLHPHRGNEQYCLWCLTSSPIFLVGKLREICETMPRSKEIDYFWDVDARELL
ncbi:MAG: primosomal protein N' [Puniceicoccales bacterium]|jgi:primosomal protein N' (replication factor Y)|nr:primosomal protein N' [Puniceicoccales bacterium]